MITTTITLGTEPQVEPQSVSMTFTEESMVGKEGMAAGVGVQQYARAMKVPPQAAVDVRYDPRRRLYVYTWQWWVVTF